MQFRFSHPNNPAVIVRIAKYADIGARIAMFGESGPKASPRQRMGALYARATYLKFRSAVEEFSAVATTLEQWAERRAVPDELRAETLLLLEANVIDDERVAGSLLLRSAWNNDVIVDFLVVNQEVTESRPIAISGVSALLCFAGFALSETSGAGRVFVETAHHTRAYWPRFCAGGAELIRCEETAVARKATAAIIRAGKWTSQIEL